MPGSKRPKRSVSFFSNACRFIGDAATAAIAKAANVDTRVTLGYSKAALQRMERLHAGG